MQRRYIKDLDTLCTYIHLVPLNFKFDDYEGICITLFTGMDSQHDTQGQPDTQGQHDTQGLYKKNYKCTHT